MARDVDVLTETVIRAVRRGGGVRGRPDERPRVVREHRVGRVGHPAAGRSARGLAFVARSSAGGWPTPTRSSELDPGRRSGDAHGGGAVPDGDDLHLGAARRRRDADDAAQPGTTQRLRGVARPVMAAAMRRANRRTWLPSGRD